MSFINLERSNDRHLALFHTERQLLEPTALHSLELDPYCDDKSEGCSPKESSFGNGLWLMGTTSTISALAEILV